MKLLFDLTALQPSQGRFHGGGEYARTILFELLKSGKSEFECIYNPSQWIDPEITDALAEKNIVTRTVTSVSDIEMLLHKNGYDVFYSALPYNYGPLNCGKTCFAMTIHGLRDLEMPTDRYEYLYNTSLSFRIKYLIKKMFPGWYKNFCRKKTDPLLKNTNKKLFVPSLHTKYSLMNFFNVPEEDIHVFYSPEKISPKPEVHENDTEKIAPLPEKGYILIVGGNRWIKNAYRALRALSDYISDGVPVVVCGGTNLKRYFKNSTNFHFIDYVEASTLEYLYSSCYFLLYPTLNEGFGYPPLEVMKYGKPVIASAVASITEIYGDSIVYCNPYSVDEIANRITMMINDNNVYNMYQKKAKQFYKLCSLEQKDSLKKLVKQLSNYDNKKRISK